MGPYWALVGVGCVALAGSGCSRKPQANLDAPPPPSSATLAPEPKAPQRVAKPHPVVLARDQANVSDLAVFHGFVYWVAQGSKGFRDGAIRRTRLGGGQPETVATVSGPRGFAIDDQGMYWTAEPTVEKDGRFVGAGREAKAGTLVFRPPSGGERKIVARGFSDPLFIRLDDKNVYWAAGSWEAVLAMPRKGTEPPWQALVEHQGRVSSLALDATHVYFAVDNRRRHGTHSGHVSRVAKAGGEGQELAGDQQRPWGVAVDDTHVYWSSHGGYKGVRAMFRVVKGGGELEELARVDTPTGIGLDDKHVYFACGRGVGRIAKTGGSLSMVSEAGPVKAIALGGAHICWADTMKATIECAGKP